MQLVAASSLIDFEFANGSPPDGGAGGLALNSRHPEVILVQNHHLLEYDIVMAIYRPSPIDLIVVLAVSWVFTAIRVGFMARRYGRRRLVWFFITLLCSAIPAMIVYWLDYRRQVTAANSLPGFRQRATRRTEDEQSAAIQNCSHCGGVLEVEQTVGGKCPHCRMQLSEGHVA